MHCMGMCSYCYDDIDCPADLTPLGDHTKCQNKHDARKAAGLCVYCGKKENYDEEITDWYHETCANDGTYHDY